MSEENRDKICPVCGKLFRVPPVQDDRYINCSIKCRRVAEKRARDEKELSKVSKAIAASETHRLTPNQSAKIRGEISRVVQKHIDLANQVVHGSIDWSPTQARVFSTLLNKVVPDLSASYVQHEHSTKDLVDMSRDELERIAAGLDAIDVEVEEIDSK